jgi:arylformamidase
LSANVRWIFLIFILCFTAQTVSAGTVRTFMERNNDDIQDDSDRWDGMAGVPKGVKRFQNVPYGPDNKQRFDVYISASGRLQDAPVIFMVHGGGWRHGDKGSKSVVENKVAGWVPRGIIFISINYRLLPQADPLAQADDVARALAAAQARARSWGGDPSKFILMGHSAGAHLVALLTADPSRISRAGVKPCLGSILLDSAAMDVVQIMEGKHLRLYDNAFGDQRSYWQSASPIHALSAKTPPILAVCSTRRADSCPQAKAFTDKAASFGAKVKVLEENLSHREINKELGAGNGYTKPVEDFMGSLDPSVQRALNGK